MGLKSVRSVSFDVACYCRCCLTIFVFETATVHVTFFISDFNIFFASATTLLFVPSINSSGAYFAS